MGEVEALTPNGCYRCNKLREPREVQRHSLGSGYDPRPEPGLGSS